MSERKTICPSCGFDRWKDKDPRGSENGASTLQAYETIREGYKYGPYVQPCLRCGVKYELFVPGRDTYRPESQMALL